MDDDETHPKGWQLGDLPEDTVVRKTTSGPY